LEIFEGDNCLLFDPEKQFMRDMPAYFAMSSYYWEFFRFMNVRFIQKICFTLQNNKVHFHFSSTSISFSDANNRIEDICGQDFYLTDEQEEFYNETDCFETSYIFDILTKVSIVIAY